MDRSREARRATMAASNGLSRRRHRGSSLRDSPEEDGPELQETARLRDRGGSGKKDRDRDRDRERDRDRLSRSKRRRADRLLHSREDGGEESSEESVNDEEDDEDDDGAASVRMLPPNPPPLLSSTAAMSNHRKSFPPPAKVFRAAPTWKAADEMIGVSVPRKARSASTKRSHECWASSASGVGVEQIHRQASTSPVRPSLVSISVAAASPAPASPSSSNASLRKKMKPNGPKLRPPKSSSKSSSSAQDEIEIEIAEVLYGMLRQPQGPSKQEILTDSVKFDTREPNKSGDAKSRVSSPISNSTSAAPQSSSIPPQNSSSSVTPMSAVVAPKRKKPRPVKYDDENPSIFTVRNSPISTTTKAEIDQPAKIEASSSPNLEKKSGSVAENGGVPNDLANPQVVLVSSEAPPESTAKPESHPLSDSKPSAGESEGKDVGSSKEEPQSPKKESPLVRVDDSRDDVKANKANSTMSELENHKEEKFQIDLMAPPPPPLRSSPERDGVIDFVAVDPKSMVTDAETEIKPVVKDDEKAVKICKEEAVNVENEKAKSLAAEEAQSQTPVVARKERNIDLQVDLEKTDRDSGTASVSGNKFHHHVQKQQPQHGSTERTAQTSPLPLPMSVPGWPGGLPPMGYMAPLQGVVSMDGSTVTPTAIQPPHLLFTQPRPKRCATHCYIARNILYHQQLARMNPFWPAAAGSASLYGAKPCNLNVVPPAELHGNIPGRGVNSAQDKGQGLAMFTGHTGKDKGSQAAANIVDTSQRKQILLQPALPPGAPSNILHGPAFIFPLNQQQPAGAPSARSGSGKSPPAAGSAASTSASNSAAVSASATAAAATAAPMSFNYPNMPGNETPYLAILQNNGYTFPIPAHVGAPPAYRGTHAQAMPFFNGSFYSSPMLHPAQIHHHHQQQQQQQQPPPQSQQSLQAHQNASVSSGSSSSQKHLQNQQQRPHGNGVNGGAGNVQGFPAPKNQSSQPLQLQQQQRQQQQNQHVPHQARQLESEMGAEDSPSSADSRVSRANVSIYGQNFAMPIHSPNLGFMNPAMMGGASGAGSASGNHAERKQQHGSKVGVEPPSSQAFPISFASMNGPTTAPGLDISSIAQNHPLFQNNYQQIMAAAAAQVAQQKKNYRVSEDGKTGGVDSSNLEEERKATPGKASATVGQSIAFSRPELADASVTTVKGNTVIDSSTRSLNLGSAPGRASGSVMPSAMNTVNAPGSQQQLQRNQQQQIIQLQKQHQFPVAAAARSKTPVTSNGIVYPDHHLPSSSSMATKFNNALSSFPQNLVQTSSGSPAQSPQWKNSVRTATTQVPSPPLSSSNSSSLKNPLQQQGRTQQSHTQISFGGNAKSSTPQGQQPPSSNQSPSPPVMVGSPTTSSMSKSAGGSPRTTASTSTANKAGQASTLSSQQAKNAPSVPSRKSSPVGGRNVPSILGNLHITSTSDSATKPQLSQQQQQPQQFPKQIQQAQLYFSNGYMHPQAPHSTGTTPGSPASQYYIQRNRREQQQQQQQQQPQGSSGASSTGMLSMCPPVTLVNTSTSDPGKVAAAATAANNMKGGGLPSQGILHVTQFNTSTSDPGKVAAAAATAASNMKGGGLPSQGILHVTQFGAAQSPGNPHQLLPASFSYMRAVPTPVPVKPAEQKQPAGE